MRAVATTAIRHTRLGVDVHGRVFDVDLDTGRTLNSFPIPDPLYIHSNPNPRGGARGGRGIQQSGDHILISNNDTIYIYDLELRLRHRISNHLMANIHEILVDGKYLWVTATDIDTLVKVDFEGELQKRWCIHEQRGLSELLGLNRPPRPKWDLDYRRHKDPTLDRVHLNGVVRGRKDHLIITLGRIKPRADAGRETDPYAPNESRDVITRMKQWLKRTRIYKKRALGRIRTRGMIMELDTNNWMSSILFTNPTTVPDHNGIPWDETRLLLNKTVLNEVLTIDKPSGAVLSRIRVPGNWLRGMDRLDERRVVVGSGPPGLHIIDIESNRLERSIWLGKNSAESIHGICIIDDERKSIHEAKSTRQSK